MGSQLSLRNSINFVAPILKNQPLLVSGQEPALTAGNMVLGSMIGPPMRWRFNRGEFNFPITTGGGTDYAVSVTDLGWIETQWLLDSSGNVVSLNGAVSLPKSSDQARPEKIAPQFDNNAGSITFRFDKVPDQNYTAYCDYQRKAVLMTSDASLWAPVPDEFEYIYQQGFLCLMSLLVNDARYPIFENYFIARLLGAQDGLTEQERNIFVANWAALTATLKRADIAVTQGGQGRGR